MTSIADALCLLAVEGMEGPEWRKAKIKKKIRRDARKKGWDKEVLRQCDHEWQWRVCCARLQLGALDWEGWQYRRPRAGMIPFHYPAWDGKPVKRLLVFGEQGVGDEVMFSQCIPDVKALAEEVVFECEPRLATLFERSFGVTCHGRKDLRDASWIEEPFDAQIPLGSLPQFFRRKREDFLEKEYLAPDPGRVKEFEVFRGKVGVTWKGRQGFIDPQKLPDGVSLQYGVDDHFQFEVPDLDLTEDIEGVIALCSVLKKVVGVANSTMHFAASVGTPCDVILMPDTGDTVNALNWRWGMDDRTPWHPSVKVYRGLDSYLGLQEK